MRSLQTRILVLFLGLLLPVVVLTVLTVQRASYRHARGQVADELLHGRQVFLDKLLSRQKALADAADTLAKDDALRQAIFADPDDRESLLVALNNHRVRTGADLSLLVELDGRILVDTLRPQRRGEMFAFPQLLDRGLPFTSEPLAVVLDGRAYQLVSVPYYVPVSAPEPTLWLLLGQALDDRMAREIGTLTGLEISFTVTPAPAATRAGQDDRTILASSLPTPARGALAAAGPGSPAGARDEDGRSLSLAGQEYLFQEVPLRTFPAPDESTGQEGAHARNGTGAPLTAVLMRSTAEAFLELRALSGELLWIAAISLLLAGIGAFLVARSVTRPVRALEQAARRLGGGDYAAYLPTGERGEIGQLAREFGRMQEGIREREAAIHHLAYHDDLTGLPNRNRFRRDAAEAIDAARRAGGRLAVAVLDLDHFKDINDTLGHHAGDRLLLQVARRLQEAADEGGMMVARLGGDEFAVLLPATAVRDAGEALATLRQRVGGRFATSDVEVDVDASVGIALYPDHGADPATLLRQAEVAMYVAKSGRLGLAFYDSSQDRHSVQRLALIGELRRAVEGDELHLCYQPKVDLRSGRTREVEALVRWRHPRLGMVPPGEFIPLAEQTGTIRQLTRWVLQRALAQAAAWEREGIELGVAVNVSALDLGDRDLPLRLAELLASTGVSPQRVVLEVTESSVMSDPDTARRILDEVTAMGIAVSVDDFGTGYSSLAQLQRLPVQELKVDRSFVQQMERSPEVALLVRATVEMGHALGLRVVAEGVENAAVLTLLREMGCDVVQGYHLGEPMGAAELARRLPGLRAGAAT